MKTPEPKSEYPKHNKVGSVVVTVFDESTAVKKKYRVRWYTGRHWQAATFPGPESADTFAISKASRNGVQLDIFAAAPSRIPSRPNSRVRLRRKYILSN
jgi:hypothetical protein